jgi:hypothetical protein
MGNYYKMKSYHVFLMFLKVAMVVQLVLILLKIQKEDSVIYLISEFAFKLLLGLFLMVYFFIAGSADFDFWDEVFISFGGGLLMFDAVYNVLPKVFLRYGIYFNPYTFYLSNHPENGATAAPEQTLLPPSLVPGVHQGGQWLSQVE